MIAENPDTPLDDLVAAKKLNQDQKGQILRKPGLQAQLKQLEEQLANYKTFGEEYEERFTREKAKLVESHISEVEQAKHDALEEAKSTYEQKKEEDLLVLTQFLHAAASKRQTEAANTEEGRAFEGALLLVYQGNKMSLTTLKNIVEGSDETVPDDKGTQLEFTFAQLKQASKDSALPAEDEDDVDIAAPSPTVEEATPALTSDPTIAHAGLTELEDTAPPPSTNGAPTQDTMSAPEQSSTGAEAANAMAESNWDPQASIISNASAGGEGWVEVPRDPAETDTGLAATPAAMHGAASWAEEVTEGATAEEKAAIENDGFEQVVHHQRGGPGRGRGNEGRGRGDFRGRGGRAGRGDGRGGGRPRGDGDRRGGRGRGDGPRGARRGGGGEGRADRAD